MWITKLIEVVILEIEIDDLVGTDTLPLKPVTINLHNGGFTATANAGYHFDKRLVFESNLYFPEKGCHLGTNRSDNET